MKNGKKAIELYKELFDAKLVDHRPFSKEMGSELGFPDEFDYENSTIHAELDIDDATVMLSDNTMEKLGGGNVQVLLALDSKKKLEEINEKVQKMNFNIICDVSVLTYIF